MVPDPDLDTFCDALWLEDGLTPRSLESYRRDLTQLFAWLEPQGIAPHQAQRDRIQAFLAHRTLDEGIAARSLARQLTAIKRYHRWLLREGRRTDDPTLTVDAPRLPKPLPKTLSEAEVEALLNAPDTETSHGLRDRAMLEALYAAGFRVSELVGLPVAAVSLTDGVARVMGKGRKERLVPLGEEAREWIARYAKESRPALLKGKGSEALARAVELDPNQAALRTQLALGHEPLEDRRVLAVAVVEAAHQELLLLLRRRNHDLGFLAAPREGLLAQHMLARIRGFHHPLRVEVVGQRDVHGLDLPVGEQLLVGAVCLRDAQRAGSLLGLLQGAGRDGMHRGRLQQGERRLHP